MLSQHACDACPVQSHEPAAGPAVVRLGPDGKTWELCHDRPAVHLVALFRDPRIVDERPVNIVLDLQTTKAGRLMTGRNCWVDRFLDELQGLPPGLTVALDNGVRCPCPTTLGPAEYSQRAKHCNVKTQHWVDTLQHPDGDAPGIAICDKTLVGSLVRHRLLAARDGTAWRVPKRFVDAVGAEVTYLGRDALILAHPVIFKRSLKDDYSAAFKANKIVEALIRLAGISVQSEPARHLA